MYICVRISIYVYILCLGNTTTHIHPAKNIPTYRFSSDTQAELDLVCDIARQVGAFDAVISNHWALGGRGAEALGHAVIRACAETRALEVNPFRFLYPLDIPIKDKIEAICKSIYGAVAVEYSDIAELRIQVGPSMIGSMLYTCIDVI
jgi:formyltetrahydrofolate synthetase